MAKNRKVCCKVSHADSPTSLPPVDKSPPSHVEARSDVAEKNRMPTDRKFMFVGLVIVGSLAGIWSLGLLVLAYLNPEHSEKVWTLGTTLLTTAIGGLALFSRGTSS